MLDAIDTAVSSFSDAFDRLNKAAARVAHDGADGNLVGSILDMQQAAQQARADLVVIRTADETIGSLLDVMA